MKRKEFIKIAGTIAVAVAVLPLTVQAGAGPESQKPNVVLFFVDDM